MTCFLVVDPHCSRKAYYVIYIFLLESVSVHSPRTQSSSAAGTAYVLQQAGSRGI